MHFRLTHTSEATHLASPVSLMVDNCAESDIQKGCPRSGRIYLEACLCQVYPLLAGCTVPTARPQVGSLCSAALYVQQNFCLKAGGGGHPPLSPCGFLQCSVLSGPGEVTQAAVCFPLSRLRSEQSGQDPGLLVSQSIQVLSKWG